VSDALAATFDHLDGLSGATIDREVVVESLVRMQLSTLIVPADPRWSARWNDAAEDIESWIMTLSHKEFA
jgi:hypothetical protein